MSHVFMSRPVSSSVLKWHECVNVTRVYHACHVLCKVSRLFVYARVMFCTNATRVYAIARFMFGAKCHASLCQCHVLYRMSPVFMPLSCSVQNVTRVYARVMFCGKCHTCLCHWPCHVMCKMPHLIMQLAVSCFVQNATRDYTIGRVMLCARCHTWLCHWPCHAMCKIPHVIMPLAVSRSVQNVTSVYAIGRVMLCAKYHVWLCPCHVLGEMWPVFIPVNTFYAKYHICLCHCPPRVLCKKS